MIFHAKTQPPPACLAAEKAKANGNYNCHGVLRQLVNDFKNKCYLCEDKEPHTINTEHFLPHRGDKNLKFDWNNLFYCCGHCNNTKLGKEKYDLILNCTNEADDVEINLKYKIDPYPNAKVLIISNIADVKSTNTADLLNEVYNGTTENKKLESANLRSKLLKEIKEFQDLLFQFYDTNLIKEEKEVIKGRIIHQLRPTSNFTAFKKWILRDNEVLAEDFASYI